jgi:hypothetical protein
MQTTTGPVPTTWYASSVPPGAVKGHVLRESWVTRSPFPLGLVRTSEQIAAGRPRRNAARHSIRTIWVSMDYRRSGRQGVSRVVEAVGSMFEVSFDGSDVVIRPRFREGIVVIPVALVSAVTIRMPKTLASGGLRFTIPFDPDVDGIRVEFFSSQASAFFDMHAAIMQAVANHGGSASGIAQTYSGDLAVITSLRQVSSLSDVEFGIRRSELLADA